jgi:hypothetical protein
MWAGLSPVCRIVRPAPARQAAFRWSALLVDVHQQTWIDPVDWLN